MMRAADRKVFARTNTILTSVSVNKGNLETMFVQDHRSARLPTNTANPHIRDVKFHANQHGNAASVLWQLWCRHRGDCYFWFYLW